jgi:Uma2 family endonuclease
LRVWVVDPRDRSIAVFQPDSTPRIDREGVVLTDVALPELELAVGELF